MAQHPVSESPAIPAPPGHGYRIRLTGARRETFVELDLVLDDDVFVEVVLLPHQVFELARRMAASIEPCEPKVLEKLRKAAWRAGTPAIFEHVPVRQPANRRHA